MKKIILAVVATIIFMNVASYVQNYKVIGTVVGVRENVITFELNDGNIYEWESKKEFILGEKCELTMFDCENCDPTDDVIVKVTCLN